MSQTLEIDGVRIMSGNSKMGSVLHINLPPCKSCDTSLPCFTVPKACYAINFYRFRQNVRDSWESNWRVLMRDRDRYFGAVEDALLRKRPKMFRWHSAGDIPDSDYLRRMLVIAKHYPWVKFMVFTKKYDIVGLNVRAGNRPKNLAVVLSGWPGVTIPPAIRRRFPTAWMRDPKNPDPQIPVTAQLCSGKCETCCRCWNLVAGESVVFKKH